MVEDDIDNFYPQVVVSYASGQRPNDAKGTGPGLLQAFQFIKQLKENGHMCFSGLHVPVGEDWKIFLLRLDSGETKAKVFIALLTRAYFQSQACMEEMFKAIKENVKIVLVALEDLEKHPVKTVDQWPNVEDKDLRLKRMAVREKMQTNHVPSGGLLNVPEAFKDILTTIRKMGCTCDAPRYNSIFEPSSSEQVFVMEAEGKAQHESEKTCGHCKHEFCGGNAIICNCFVTVVAFLLCLHFLSSLFLSCLCSSSTVAHA
jgi:hypothetical protein